MAMQRFIKLHRAEIDGYIMGKYRGHKPRNDDEREEWILNDEGLYNWARNEGVDA